MAKATAHALDMSEVKDGGQYNPKHRPEGDYKGKIVDVVDQLPKKKEGEKRDKTPMWVFSIKIGSGTYPYYCKLQPNQLWKVRNLAIAAGKTVPKKKIKLDPNSLVGKLIAVTLEDDEYDGKMKSVISATFPLSELEHDDDDEEEDEEGDEDEEDEEEEEDEDDDDEEEDEEDDEEEEVKPKKKKKDSKKNTSKKKKKKKDDDDDDELDDIDIDDV